MPPALRIEAVDLSRTDIGPVEALFPSVPKRIFAEMAVLVDERADGILDHGMGLGLAYHRREHSGAQAIAQRENIISRPS
jgi:hypothetical protein